MPQRTASTYGDWVVRCDVATGPPLQKTCDMAQLFESKTQGAPPAISQVLITRPNKKEPMRLVVQLQANVLIQPGIRVVYDEKQPLVVPLSRCFPNACFASGTLADDITKRLRGRTDPVRIEFKDGSQRDVTVNLSMNGFVAAFDAWQRE
jgi:invasion protein IalB